MSVHKSSKDVPREDKKPREKKPQVKGKDEPPKMTPRRICAGKDSKKCSSFMAKESPHNQCTRCRSCSRSNPCSICKNYTPQKWEEIVRRGKHGVLRKPPGSDSSAQKKSTPNGHFFQNVTI
jgi:hypothetical protein